MLIELLSMSNYVHFNVKLAQILGLNASIYLSQLMDINEKAIRKDKMNENFFTIDRSYIEKRTTLNEDTQKDIENNLIKIGVLERSSDNADMLLLNITVLTSIMMSPDEDLIKNVSKLAKVKNTKTKQQKIVENLKSNIVTINPELRQAYFDWIDTVYAKDGFMTKQAVISAQSTIDSFSNRNLDVALKILEIASINGYRDVQWAINNYNKEFKVGYSFSSTNTNLLTTPSPTTDPIVARKRLSDEVF